MERSLTRLALLLTVAASLACGRVLHGASDPDALFASTEDLPPEEGAHPIPCSLPIHARCAPSSWARACARECSACASHTAPRPSDVRYPLVVAAR